MAIKKYTHARKLLLAFIIVLVLVITGCKPKPSRPALSADEVKTISAEFERVSKAHVDALNTHDTGLITQLYTDDIKYYEEGNYPNFAGIKGLSSLLNIVFSGNPDYTVSIEDTFIGHEDEFIFYKMWNWAEIPQENPLLTYYRYILREGKIAEWWIFWDAKALAEAFSGWPGATLDPKPLQDYSSAWSSGDPETVANLYAINAVRQDALFGYDQQGSPAIKEFAANFFAWYPSLRLELLKSFEFLYSYPVMVGGVYAIHVSDQAGKPCDVHAIILLKSSQNKIVNEWVFYQADSLVACGWAK